MANDSIIVHMIGHAHLDPVWLWRWPTGAGEVLNTCRSAADLMDAYPDFVLACSDMWVHRQVQHLDPELFDRIRGHVLGGQWQIVGGWVVQPDCNLPTAESFRRQASIGKAYFRDTFGLDITVGFNVDSFGHNAMLPRFLVEAGYDSYVFTRPGESEMALPGSLFRWSSSDGAEVLAWRMAGGYGEYREDLTDQIRAAVAAADPRIGHVMCFYGVCDHGGGPTRRQIEWIRSQRTAISGATLVLSHPRAFFNAVKPHQSILPKVQGELQYHAIGCYSVVRDIKRHMRRAEYGLLSAEKTVESFPAEVPAEAGRQIEAAWTTTLFNQFHDILAGSSIATAYEDARDQLGAARDTADRITQTTLLRHCRHLPPDPAQRIVVFNPSSVAFRGFARHEPWLGWGAFRGRLLDENAKELPHQHLLQESHLCIPPGLLLWPVEIEPGALRVFRLLDDATHTAKIDTDVAILDTQLSNSSWHVRPGAGSDLLFARPADSQNSALNAQQGWSVQVLPDLSDTWSHGQPGYGTEVVGAFALDRIVVEESGPLRASIRVDAGFGASRLSLWARVYRQHPILDIDIRILWAQEFQLAKLTIPLATPILEREDGVPGGSVRRPQNGHEFPLHDWTLLRPPGAEPFGFASPDCFSLDGTERAIRFSLLRSPPYAWHDPCKLKENWRYRHTDQGEHEFRFRLCVGATPVELKAMALQEQQPLLIHDWTKGMPS